MAKKPIARLGDPISHGGSVVTGSFTSLCDGRPIARVGDTVACPLHGSQVILPSANTTSLVDGRPIAHVGSTTSCGATIIKKLCIITILVIMHTIY